MTISYVNTIDAKEEFSELLNRVAHQQERVILTRRGKEIAALVPIADIEVLLKTENESDLKEATDSLNEARRTGTTSIEELETAISKLNTSE